MDAGMTDREQMLAWQQEQKVEAQTVDQAFHYQALGIGLAVFCQAMFDALIAQEGILPGRFSREEALALLTAAVQGR